VSHWGFGSFQYWYLSRQLVLPLEGPYPIRAWDSQDPNPEYNPLHQSRRIAACFNVLLDAQSILDAEAETDMCLLKFVDDRMLDENGDKSEAVCAPGWDLDLLASALFCEPFKKCVAKVTAAIDAFGEGQPTQIESRWFLSAGWDREEEVKDAFLTDLKRQFKVDQAVSLHVYHLVHSILLGFWLVSIFVSLVGFYRFFSG
jgi:hypothetical protein